MKDKFKAGDRVKVLDGIAKGHIGTVEGPREEFNHLATNMPFFAYPVHMDDLDNDDPCGWAFEEHCLKLVYDGYEPTSWDNCIWKPSGVTV